MRTLVVLPTYNEVATIGEVLRRTKAALPDADVLVVDDSSPDGTADLVLAMAGELPGVEVLSRPRKGGLGSAYREAFALGLERGYEVLVEMDSDLSHDPAMLPTLVASVADGAALAVGSRYVPGGSIPDWSWHRRALSRGGNVYARRMLSLSLNDVTSGYRAFAAATLRAIDLSGIHADGYGFQIEMAYRVERAGGRVAEVPIEFRDRTQGHSKMSTWVIVEALSLVTWWGAVERVRRVGGRRRGRLQD